MQNFIVEYEPISMLVVFEGVDMWPQSTRAQLYLLTTFFSGGENGGRGRDVQEEGPSLLIL